MPEETSHYGRIRRWMRALIVTCLISTIFCFYSLWADTDSGLLLALISALLSCIITFRLYFFDVFMLFNTPLHSPALRNEEQYPEGKLSRFLMATPDLLWRIRYAGREVESLNDSYADIHPGARAKNIRITSLFPAWVARQYLEALIEVQSQGKIKCFEYRLPLKDNKTAIFEARIQPFSDEDCIATICDITASKMAEEALFSQQLFLYQIIDSSPLIIFVRDRFGRFLILNQTAQHTLGHEALVLSHLALTDDQALFTAGDQEVFAEGHTVHLLDYIVQANGKKEWFEVTKVPLIREKETYVLVTAMNITHLKLAEKISWEKEEYCTQAI